MRVYVRTRSGGASMGLLGSALVLVICLPIILACALIYGLWMIVVYAAHAIDQYNARKRGRL